MGHRLRCPLNKHCECGAVRVYEYVCVCVCVCLSVCPSAGYYERLSVWLNGCRSAPCRARNRLATGDPRSAPAEEEQPTLTVTLAFGLVPDSQISSMSVTDYTARPVAYYYYVVLLAPFLPGASEPYVLV